MSEVEWRRKWRPDLSVKPWRVLNAEKMSGNYLIKSSFKEKFYEILLTDSTSMWYEKLEGDAIKKRTEKLNPSVEAPLATILQHVQEHIENIKKGADYDVAFKTLADGDTKIQLNLNTKLAGIPFVWKFHGAPATKDMVCTHLTQPLLGMIGELNRRQSECYKLLEAKDKEIADLKIQGARVSRKHLETVPFDETTFQNNMSTSKGFVQEADQMGPNSFSSSTNQRLYSDMMTKRAWLTRSQTQRDSDDGEDDEPASKPAAGQSWNNRLPPSLVSQGVSPSKSPGNSPTKSPRKAGSDSDASPTKDPELIRRNALAKKLEEAEQKNETKKKKKKMKF